MHAQAAITRNVYAARSVSPYVRDAAIAQAMEDVYETMGGGQRLAKGVLVSIGLEATAGLFFYGVWLAFHVMK
jgi:hypothetical protein